MATLVVLANLIKCDAQVPKESPPAVETKRYSIICPVQTCDWAPDLEEGKESRCQKGYTTVKSAQLTGATDHEVLSTELLDSTMTAAAKVILACCLLGAFSMQMSSSSAIPIWEFLTRNEKVSR